MNNDCPLVTLIVFSYCQHDLVEDAIQAAFAQTYPNLEVILSDDGSNDQTFDVMKRLASQYEGPHQVQLNYNEHNLGLAGHINHVLKMANGEWIFLNAGDDQSLPNRCSRVMEVVSNNTDARGVFSGFHQTDEDLSPIQKKTPLRSSWNALHVCRCGGYVFPGATFCFHREAIIGFGELPADVRAEDWVLPLRAALQGRVVCIEDLLVKKRTSPDSLTHVNRLEASNSVKSDFMTPELNTNLKTIEEAKNRKVVSGMQASMMRMALKQYRRIHQCRFEYARPSRFQVLRGLIAALFLMRKNDVIELFPKLFRIPKKQVS